MPQTYISVEHFGMESVPDSYTNDNMLCIKVVGVKPEMTLKIYANEMQMGMVYSST